MEQTIFNILTSAQAQTDSIRLEAHNGVNYMIVPVVALVEGVLHSANADFAELALAEEFGKQPAGWDGRPLVMNHPKVNGTYVSANSIGILEEWSLGQIFNTVLDGNKLKTEAWINLDRVAAVGGEFQEVVDRLNAGEMVEISTGLFSSVEQTHGTFNGAKYHGIWRNVMPDHLALLSAGTIGACSVAGGCGAPRINHQEIHHIRALEWNGHANAASTSSPKLIGSDAPPNSDCSCGCGGACSGASPVDNANETIIDNIGTRSHEEQIARMQQTIANLQVNSVPSDMPSENVYKLLKAALRESFDLYCIHTWTADVVVYERWDSSKVFQRSFTISSENSVTIGDDEVEVLLMTKIVTTTPTPKANESTETTEAEETTSSEPEIVTEPTQEPVMETTTQTPEATTTTPVVANATPAVVETVAPAAPVTVNAYIDAAPAEIQEVLSEGLRLHQAKRDRMTKEIMANAKNTFTEDALKAMSMGNLEAIHSIAHTPVVVNSYAGRATPVNPQAHQEANSVPRPLEAFPVKKREVAA